MRLVVELRGRSRVNIYVGVRKCSEMSDVEDIEDDDSILYYSSEEGRPSANHDEARLQQARRTKLNWIGLVSTARGR